MELTQRDAVRAEHVSHAYGLTPALVDVSFSVVPGALAGLLGPNGSGKTTLFRLLSTLLEVQTGHLSVSGLDLRTQQILVRRNIGVTFQSPALDGRLTVAENLHCQGRLYGIRQNVLREQIAELALRFRFEDRMSALVSTLSGGLKRRVELAKGLLHQPAIVLLDEPTSGLDVWARQEFLALISEQRRQFGTTVIVATHLMEEAEQCDSLLLLDRGRVVALGSPDQLRASLTGERLTIRCRDNTAVKSSLCAMLEAPCRETGGELAFQIDRAADRLPAVLDRFRDQILSIEAASPSLEDVFLNLTGHSLRGQEVGT